MKREESSLQIVRIFFCVNGPARPDRKRFLWLVSPQLCIRLKSVFLCWCLVIPPLPPSILTTFLENFESSAYLSVFLKHIETPYITLATHYIMRSPYYCSQCCPHGPQQFNRPGAARCIMWKLLQPLYDLAARDHGIQFVLFIMLFNDV